MQQQYQYQQQYQQYQNNGYPNRRNDNKKAAKLIVLAVGVFLLLFGAIFLAVGTVAGGISKGMEKRCTEPVTATVIEMRESTRRNNGHYSTTYAPVFTYEYNGTTYTYRSSTYSSPPEFQVGDVVEAKCNPDKPSELWWDSNVSKILFLVFSIVGGVISGIGLIMIIVNIVGLIRLKSKMKNDELADYNYNSYNSGNDNMNW